MVTKYKSNVLSLEANVVAADGDKEYKQTVVQGNRITVQSGDRMGWYAFLLLLFLFSFDT